MTPVTVVGSYLSPYVRKALVVLEHKGVPVLIPERPIYPTDVAERARARWLEEFADSRMGDVFVWQLFQQLAINPRVFGRPTDKALVEDHLESLAPEKGFLFGDFSIADLSIATFFRTVEFVRFRIDAARWPRTAGLVERALANESFQRLRPFEDRMASVPPPQQRAALAEMGAPLTDDTYATATLTPSIMLRD